MKKSRISGLTSEEDALPKSGSEARRAVRIWRTDRLEDADMVREKFPEYEPCPDPKREKHYHPTAITNKVGETLIID